MTIANLPAQPPEPRAIPNPSALPRSTSQELLPSLTSILVYPQVFAFHDLCCLCQMISSLKSPNLLWTRGNQRITFYSVFSCPGYLQNRNRKQSQHILLGRQRYRLIIVGFVSSFSSFGFDLVPKRFIKTFGGRETFLPQHSTGNTLGKQRLY